MTGTHRSQAAQSSNECLKKGSTLANSLKAGLPLIPAHQRNHSAPEHTVGRTQTATDERYCFCDGRSSKSNTCEFFLKKAISFYAELRINDLLTN